MFPTYPIQCNPLQTRKALPPFPAIPFHTRINTSAVYDRPPSSPLSLFAGDISPLGLL